MNRSAAETLLRSAVGDSSVAFRPGQWEAIDAVANQRKKLLVVQRTGWGKSSVYFIATRILRDEGAGVTLIISPLLALMRNQLEAANRLNIRAETINSTNRDDWGQITERVLANETDALLVSPERLSNAQFIEEVLTPVAEDIGLLVVDEAHCISDWGHDFRPDYMRIVNILKRLPANTALLATTATANDRVIEDIEGLVGGIQVLRGSLVRESLMLQNLRIPKQADRLAWLAEHIPNLPGTGIVYALTKLDADRVAGWLRQNGIEAAAYYAGVKDGRFADSDAYRVHLEDLLQGNRLKALVATSALGMGYDKPDLGFVIHYQMPGSVVAYYQQVGRAGRAIDLAYGILMSGDEDEEILEYFRNTAFPQEADVERILLALKESDGLSVRALQPVANLRYARIEGALKYLSVQNPSPVMHDDGKWHRTVNEWKMPHAEIARLSGKREVEWQEMQAYLATNKCLMTFLRRSLNDPVEADCGKCASCRNADIVGSKIDHRMAVEASRYLRRSELPIEPRRQIAKGQLKVFGLSGRLGDELRAEEGRVLSRWGDAGWGTIVSEDKHSGRFRDELVDAVADMIRERWCPQPNPEWVTCVPSRRHRTLVPDFAHRLADRLEIPFVEAILKVRDNEAQKGQQNEHFQCRNLDGAFEVEPDVPTGPVFLVDDIVDSRWTLCVLAALLRRAGVARVFPVALASTSPGG